MKSLNPPLSLSLFFFSLFPGEVRARRSNSKNLEDDPIRRRDQRGRYDRAEKSYLASAIAGMELGTRVFLPPSFRDVEWYNLVAIAIVHRRAEIVRLPTRPLVCEIIKMRGSRERAAFTYDI